MSKGGIVLLGNFWRDGKKVAINFKFISNWKQKQKHADLNSQSAISMRLYCPINITCKEDDKLTIWVDDKGN